jgi:molybdopterin synthase catalytic subunit
MPGSGRSSSASSSNGISADNTDDWRRRVRGVDPPSPGQSPSSPTYDDSVSRAEHPTPVARWSESDLAPPTGETWVGLSDSALPVAEAAGWVVRPDCGGVVVFTGTARDHAEGRTGVTVLEYEAYAEHVVPVLTRVASDARDRFPDLGRIALLHRVGRLQVTDAAVVVAVSAPHRGQAFDAARMCIDDVKATAPIWKREHWAGGVDWGRTAQ